jgi:hypothetical protein
MDRITNRSKTALALLLVGNGLAFLAAAELTPGAGSFKQAARAEGEQLYLEIHRVLTHPRCLNCHPKGDSPRQGDAARLHMPPVTRGPADKGVAGLQCAACHQAKNYAASAVPGAPNWHLAPLSMGWENMSPGELCRALLDKSKNGNKDLKAIVDHLTKDELVAWGWNPGAEASGKAREPVPTPKAEFARIVHAWAKQGAPCPE